MSEKDEFIQYILSDVLREIAGITYRPMFGAYGLYREGVFFAILSEEKLYFKTDETTKADYLAHGSQPLNYLRLGKRAILKTYYEVPAEIMENQEEIVKWVERAYQAGKKISNK
jgi:DNA transformation protein